MTIRELRAGTLHAIQTSVLIPQIDQKTPPPTGSCFHQSLNERRILPTFYMCHGHECIYAMPSGGSIMDLIVKKKTKKEKHRLVQISYHRLVNPGSRLLLRRIRISQPMAIIFRTTQFPTAKEEVSVVSTGF